MISSPIGVTLDQDGVITWRPTGEQIGNHTIEIGVMWDTGEFDIIEVNIEILNTPPTVIEFDKYASEDKVVVILEINDQDMHSVSLMCNPELSITNPTGTMIFKVQWTPNQAESLSIQCTAEDIWGGQDQYSTTLINSNKGGENTDTDSESLSEESDTSVLEFNLITVAIIGLGALIAGWFIGRLMGGRNN